MFKSLLGKRVSNKTKGKSIKSVRFGLDYSILTLSIHEAGECRRQVINVTHFVKNVNILDFHAHISNHHEKCIQQSTNMPGIGSLIREIRDKITEI